MCEIGDLDQAELWQETEPRARKAHVCGACGGAIAKGDRYVRHFSIHEGDVFAQKMCMACKPARAEFCDAHFGGSCTPSAFETFLADCVADGDPESDAKWRPMLDAMRERRRQREAAAHG